MWVTRLVGTTPVGPIVVDWGFHPSETDVVFRLGKSDSEQAEEKCTPRFDLNRSPHRLRLCPMAAGILNDVYLLAGRSETEAEAQVAADEGRLENLLRYAERARSGASSQEPPRKTRPEPTAGPTGSLTALVG